MKGVKGSISRRAGASRGAVVASLACALVGALSAASLVGCEGDKSAGGATSAKAEGSAKATGAATGTATAKASASATASAAASATASASASAAAQAPTELTVLTAKNPLDDEAGRKGECKFQKWEGAGKDKKAMFTIKVPGGEVDTVQTWLFYYDKAGKYLDRYPHSTFLQGDSQRLGQEGDKIKKETDVVECEITRITYKDKSIWYNDNLVPNFPERPKGGLKPEELKEHAGQKVQIEIADTKTWKLKLKNTADKETKRVSVALVFYKADGNSSTVRKYLEVAIKPNEVLEKTLDDVAVPEGSKMVEATAPEITFADNGKFTNRNLDSFYRKPAK
jgi:hypothetical protein